MKQYLVDLIDNLYKKPGCRNIALDDIEKDAILEILEEAYIQGYDDCSSDISWYEKDRLDSP